MFLKHMATATLSESEYVLGFLFKSLKYYKYWGFPTKCPVFSQTWQDFYLPLHPSLLYQNCFFTKKRVMSQQPINTNQAASENTFQQKILALVCLIFFPLVYLIGKTVIALF